MAKQVIKDAGLVINSVDLSAQIQQVTLNYQANNEDVTAMGDDALVRLSSLIDWSIDVTFFNDFSSGSVDDTLFPLVGGSAVAIKLIVDSTASVAAGNPMWTGNVIVQSYPPLGQSVGDAATTSVSLMSSGALTRNESGSFP